MSDTAAAPGRERGAEHVVGGALLVALAACCFGSISTLIVVATRGAPGHPGASLAGVLFWRYALAAVGLAALAAVSAGGTSPWRREPLRPTLTAILVGGLGQAGVAFLSLSALRWITVGTLAFLFYTYPAWVTLVAAVRGSERLDRRKLLALVLSLAGIACTIGLRGATAAGAPAVGVPVAAGGAWPGVLLALAGAVVYALYIPYLGALQARLTPVGASALVCVGAALLFAGPALAGTLGSVGGGAPLLRLPGAAWLAIAVLALVCTVLAFVAFLTGLARLGPVRSAIVSTVEPFFTALLGAVALGQPVGPGTVAGGVLIVLAVLLLRGPGPRDGA